MPSLNFAWTVMFGIIFLRTPYIWLKVFGIVYPVITLFAITITANHYLTDAFGGGMVILVSFLIVEIGFDSKRSLLRAVLHEWEPRTKRRYNVPWELSSGAPA